MYIKTQTKNLFFENLKTKWKKIGFILLNFDKIFNKLFKRTDLILN